MTPDSLISQGSAYVSTASGHLGDLTALWKMGEQYVSAHFGTTGVIAAYIVTGALAMAIVTKLVNLALKAVMYLVVPSVALAWIGSLFLPYSFMFLLPIMAAGFSLLFLFKA